jgi:uncharacterized protein (TIGR03437 family)
MDGRIAASRGGDQVTFNGIAGQLLYVSAAQINTVIPHSLSLGLATIQVTSGAVTDKLENFPRSQTSLALFNGLVINPDGTLNSAKNPAPKGATLVMYRTGMGQTLRPVLTERSSSSSLSRLRLSGFRPRSLAEPSVRPRSCNISDRCRTLWLARCR